MRRMFQTLNCIHLAAFVAFLEQAHFNSVWPQSRRSMFYHNSADIPFRFIDCAFLLEDSIYTCSRGTFSVRRISYFEIGFQFPPCFLLKSDKDNNLIYKSTDVFFKYRILMDFFALRLFNDNLRSS